MQSGYERMRNSLDGITLIPTYHTMTKRRPIIHPIAVQKLKPFDSNNDFIDDLDGGNGTDDSFLNLEILPSVKGPEEYQLEVALQVISSSSNKNEGARLDGYRGDWIELMEKKHREKGR
eukprot:12377041-Ditylum_brightwellii.AAC.1